MKKVFMIVSLLLILCFPAYSEDMGLNLLNYYDSEIITIGYQTFGGFNLTFHGQITSTLFGIQPAFSKALKQYDDSGSRYNSYKILNTTGNISYLTGVAAILFGSYYPFFANYDEQEPDSFWNNYLDNYKICLGFVIGGTVCTVISAITMPLAQEHLFQGVSQYNRHKIEEYQR